MHDGREAREWARFGGLLCLLANIHRDHSIKPRPFKLHDFDPYAPQPRELTEQEQAWVEQHELKVLEKALTEAEQSRGQ
jgi:hypothetical protein